MNVRGFAAVATAVAVCISTAAMAAGVVDVATLNALRSFTLIRPDWYVPTSGTLNIPPLSIADTVQIMRKFTGTVTTCDGESCNMDNMLIIGFDTCDATTKQRSILSNLMEECLVNEWIHDNGGGIKLENVVSKQFIEGGLMDASGNRIDNQQWPITNVRNDGSGGVTVAISKLGLADAVQVGYTVLISGLGPGEPPVATTGDLTSGQNKIRNIPASTGTNNGADDIQIGAVVSDLGTSGCLPGGTVTVKKLDVGDDGIGTATVSGNMSCTVSAEPLKFSFSSTSPPSANGHWLVDAVTANVNSPTCPDGTNQCDEIHLVGASWAGPTFPCSTTLSCSTWNVNTQVITVLDATNAAPGQYLCTSSTASSVPFCTPPTGFTFSTTTTTDFAGKISSYTGPIGVGSVANWPANGLVKVDSEYLAYSIASSTVIDITARGVDGTAPATHGSPVTLQAAAPVVLFAVPSSHAVVISAFAQSSCSSSCGSITLANDLAVVANPYLGQLVLNPGYHLFTSNTAAGPSPSGFLRTTATRSGAPGSTITLASGYGFKVQPGMTAIDLTNAAHIPVASQTVLSVTGDVVTLSGNTGGSFINDLVQFSGCGYPAPGGVNQPWLGNCASTSILLGGDGKLAQGVVCDHVHTYGSKIQIHAIDAPATSCTNMIISGGGDLGDKIDPDSVAVWADGKSSKTQFTNGRLGGASISILDTPSHVNGSGIGGQDDGLGFTNVQVAGSILAAPGANLLISAAHGNADLLQPIYLPAAMSRVDISGSNLNTWAAYVDQASAYAQMFCSGNVLATALCGQTKGTPSCTSGCVHSTDVSGNDSDFDVMTDGSSSSVSVVLAGKYSSSPICRVSASATSGGVAASASIGSVAFQPYGTTVTLTTSAAVPHIYGSCHSATG